MNLLNKVIYAAWFTWIVFFATHLVLATPNRIPNVDFFIAAGCIFILTGICYFAVHKPFAKLITKVKNARLQNNFNEPIEHISEDELATIAEEINGLFALIRTEQQKVADHVESRTQHLEIENKRLHNKITEHKSFEKEMIIHKEHLVRLAHYDGLTSLPNRIFFNQILNKAIAHATRHKKPLALIFIDLDRFKQINDTLGHAAGDQALKEVAMRLSAVLRAGDVLARLGGDEFIVLINDLVHPKYAGPLAEKLLTACARPFAINQQNFDVTASMGIAIFPEDGMSLEDLQQNADSAMYNAKKSGGNTYQFFSSQMTIQAQEHVELDKGLREAVAKNEFILYYQPIYNLSDGVITGVEALLRWDSPTYGLVSPNKFLPLAEETGLIYQIGAQAIKEACRVNKFWQQKGLQPMPISVNISEKEFLYNDLLQNIATALTETQLDPQYLQLEIAESTLMKNMEASAEKLSDLKRMGVQVAIDDFGTGYTSMSYLRNYPITQLKIDRSFTKDLPQNQKDAGVVGAIITLAHSLGFKVVAEGVENAEQLQFLADHDCDQVQGYYLNRPLPEQKVMLQFFKTREKTV